MGATGKDDRLIQQSLGSELLVYDTRSHRACSLNTTAAAVWKYASPSASVEMIRMAAEQELGTKLERDAVLLALRDLHRRGLISDLPCDMDTAISRRELQRRLRRSMALAFIPAVTSILVPTPVAAASCLPGGAQCANNADCCSNTCRRVGGVKVCISA